MPNSRKRRRQKDKSHRRSGNPAISDRDRARAVAEMPVLLATDAAEARGDAAAALDLIEADLASRQESNFWRPERLRRLIQLSLFGPSLPRWVTSRWILAQAAQHLDNRTRSRSLKAMEIAIETRGGIDTLRGRSVTDARAKVLDHDWVYRQVWLYEFGALEHFVTHVASPDLLAGADRIHEWMRTPMGAFRVTGETAQSVTLLDLTTGDSVTAVNIGSAALLAAGECAIGRLVPVDEGRMFESAPLFVPDGVARQVAEDPTEWLTAVAAQCRDGARSGSETMSTIRGEFGLVTDAPRVLQMDVVDAVTERLTGRANPVDISSEHLTSLHVLLMRAALHGNLEGVPLGLNPWPVVGAALLDPEVFVQFAPSLTPDDAPLCHALARRLVPPASSVCRALADEIAAAA